MEEISTHRLFMSCRGLNKIYLRVYVELRDDINNEWQQFDCTEVVENSLNPTFVQNFEFDYVKELRQFIHFKVVDVGRNGTEEDVGTVETALQDVVDSPTGYLDLQLHSKQKVFSAKSGVLRVFCEKPDDYTLEAKLSAHCLPKMDVTGVGADPYFILSCTPNSSTNAPTQNSKSPGKIVYKSPVIKGNLSPRWPEFRAERQRINLQEDHLVLSVWDWNLVQSHNFICQFTLPTPPIANTFFTLENPKKNQAEQRERAFVHIEYLRLTKAPSFKDYVDRGTSIGFMVSIDFTSSNLSHHNPGSLHYLDPNDSSFKNDYERVISEIGPIIIEMDSDKLVPAWCFGLKMNNELQFNWPLNGNHNNPEVEGIKGVLKAYRDLMRVADLDGPTNIAPTITAATTAAHEADQKAINDGKHGEYSILLIITDGDLSGERETIEAIKVASDAPLSIIIVGVGTKKELSDLKKFADRKNFVDRKARSSKRHCVQFINWQQRDKWAVQRSKKEIARQLITFFHTKKREVLVMP